MLRRAFGLVILVCASVALRAADVTPPLAGERVLWLGDSITQIGDYVTFTEYYLQRTYPNSRFDIISIGRSSETVSGLSEKTHPWPRPNALDRLPRALALVKPSVVIACYGMNDGIYHPESPERMRAFQNGMRKLIDTCHAAHARVVLLTPPPFSRVPDRAVLPATAPDFSYATPYENYDDVLASFARWEKMLPPGGAHVIDLHTPLADFIAAQRRADPHFIFAGDGIHPNADGHLRMAQIVLRGLGVTLPASADDVATELGRIEHDPVYALVKRQRETRSSAWLSYVGLPGALEVAETDVAHLQSQIDQLRNSAGQK